VNREEEDSYAAAGDFYIEKPSPLDWTNQLLDQIQVVRELLNSDLNAKETVKNHLRTRVTEHTIGVDKKHMLVESIDLLLMMIGEKERRALKSELDRLNVIKHEVEKMFYHDYEEWLRTLDAPNLEEQKVAYTKLQWKYQVISRDSPLHELRLSLLISDYYKPLFQVLIESLKRSKFQKEVDYTEGRDKDE